jgi:glycosyltransferase involved in cell wall biosynthesis
MTILWICGLPGQVHREVTECGQHHASAEWSWILGHLPPPEGVDLHIACPVTSGPWKGHSFTYKGASFHLVRCLRGRLQTGFLLDPLFFRRLYFNIRPDVVHGWGTEDSHSIIAQHLAPESHVVQVQGLINSYLDHLPASKALRYVAARERMTLKDARHVFVESDYSRAISQHYCGEHTRIWQIDHPLRGGFLTSYPTKRNSRQVLFLGSLTDRKGYLDAVAAFASTSTDWRLMMIGAGRSESVAALYSKIDALGLRERFRHLASASTDEIVRHMQESSIYLLPSYIDTGPTSLKEALAMNLWPVCYDNTGPAEFIRRFNIGTLCPTGDIPALGSALGHAIQHVQSTATKHTSCAPHVREAFCKDNIWSRLLEAYAIVAKGHPKS